MNPTEGKSCTENRTDRAKRFTTGHQQRMWQRTKKPKEYEWDDRMSEWR